MDPPALDRLIDAMARPLYVYRMNYSVSQSTHRLAQRRAQASAKLVDKARDEIHELVTAYVRNP